MSRFARMGSDLLVMASDRGLLIRTAQGDYHRYALTDHSLGRSVQNIWTEGSRAFLTTSQGLLVWSPAWGMGTTPRHLVQRSDLRGGTVTLEGDLIFSQGADLYRAPLLAAPSFEKEIAPLLKRVCVDCHAVDQAGPGPSLNLTEAGWVQERIDLIISRVIRRQDMPPANNSTLSEAEKRTILRWAETGFAP